MPLDVAFVEEGGDSPPRVTVSEVEKAETSAVRQVTFELLAEKKSEYKLQAIQTK